MDPGGGDMGGIVPNPVTISGLKLVSYGGLGWILRQKALRPGNPLGFAFIRLVAGWLVGLAFFFTIARPVEGAGGSDKEIYLLFLVPRFGIWLALVHFWFRPKGGMTALVLWCLLGVAISTAIDVLVFRFAESVPWFGIGIC
jgi:hypothetical protein